MRQDATFTHQVLPRPHLVRRNPAFSHGGSGLEASAFPNVNRAQDPSLYSREGPQYISRCVINPFTRTKQSVSFSGEQIEAFHARAHKISPPVSETATMTHQPRQQLVATKTGNGGTRARSVATEGVSGNPFPVPLWGCHAVTGG